VPGVAGAGRRTNAASDPLLTVNTAPSRSIQYAPLSSAYAHSTLAENGTRSNVVCSSSGCCTPPAKVGQRADPIGRDEESSTVGGVAPHVLGDGLAQALDAPPVAAQRHAEQVGGDLAAQPLRLELTRQLEEHAIGDVGEGSPGAAAGRELRDQRHRLAHDLVDEYVGVHLRSTRPWGLRLTEGA
jgi:hypothetical protein